jgi:predicted transcriptional regulator/transcriptional regulator with XRE-family HTH domain
MAEKLDKKAMLGHKVRRFRQDLGMSQTEMAEALEISPSYLNLIEHNQRPVTVPLLFRLGQTFEVDLRDFAEDEGARLAAGLREVFSDPMFEGRPVRNQEIRELAEAAPSAAQAVIHLYKSFAEMRTDTQALAQRLTDPDKVGDLDGRSFPVEEVRDYFEDQSNYFAELEQAAESLWADAELDDGDLFAGLAQHMDEAFGVTARVMPVDVMTDTLRRYDLHRRRVLLSEALPRSGRIFQLAVQVALFGQKELLERMVAKGNFSSPEAERLAHAGLAGYFAGAVMMPYERFHAAARDLRYDIEILRHRFGASFEQVCHRLTTLHRAGARGVPFFFVRVDNAGNVSKRLSAGGMQLARFGGTCPKWVVHDAFRAPGMIHTQLAELPDGSSYLTVARTVEPAVAGFGRQGPRMAVAVGCDASHAKQIVYGDGFDIKQRESATEVGVSCRVCERMDCPQRAHPPLNHRLKFDENVRRITPFSIVAG